MSDPEISDERLAIPDKRLPETAGLSLTKNRHGFSTPTLIPIRALVATRRAGSLASSIRKADPTRSRWFCASEIPSARVRLPGPRQSDVEVRSAARLPVPRARRRRISASPSSGSSARINTAAGHPSGSVTAFTR
jgi:hypothetical protein